MRRRWLPGSAGLERGAGSSPGRGRLLRTVRWRRRRQARAGGGVCCGAEVRESQGGGSKEVWGALAGKGPAFPAATRAVWQLGLGLGLPH